MLSEEVLRESIFMGNGKLESKDAEAFRKMRFRAGCLSDRSSNGQSEARNNYSGGRRWGEGENAVPETDSGS